MSSIKNAENENNRKVYIYSDDGVDPVEATYDLVNGVDTYTAEINIPENTSDTEDKIYTLKAKIGDTEQTSVNSTIRQVFLHFGFPEELSTQHNCRLSL